MNIEQNKILQEFCNGLEDTDVICSQCANALRRSVYLSIIDISNPNRNGSLRLHVRCTSRLIESIRKTISEYEWLLSEKN